MKRYLLIVCLLFLAMYSPVAQAFSIAGTVTGGNPIGFPPHLKYVIAIPLRLDTANFLSNFALVSPLNSTYSFTSLDSGSYILFSFQDMNINFMPDLDEPRGFWATDTLLGVPTIMQLVHDTTGINIVLNPPNSGGFTGAVSYDGAQRGRTYVLAYHDAGFNSLGGIGTMLDTTSNGNGNYTAIADSFGTYYANAYMDVNGNFQYDEDEPYGIYGSTTPSPINIQQGNFPSNVNITLHDPAASTNEFSGVVSYEGTHRGPAFVVAFRSPAFTTPHGFGAVLDAAHTGNGPYTAQTDSAGTFYAYAFMDLNNNGLHDPAEPFGVYGGQTPAPFLVQPNDPPGNVDITLLDAAAADPRTSVLPVDVRLSSVYPNPFNNSAMVTFTVGTPMDVELALYDLLGRQAQVLVKGQMTAGEHRVALQGQGLSTGVYVVKLSSAHRSETRTVLLLK